jgi:hypothetical protein
MSEIGDGAGVEIFVVGGVAAGGFEVPAGVLGVGVEAEGGWGGGAAGEQACDKASYTEGGDFEETAGLAVGLADGFAGRHDGDSRGRICSNCMISGDIRWPKSNFRGSGETITRMWDGGMPGLAGGLMHLIAATNIRIVDSK